jgi:hypothetical protein
MPRLIQDGNAISIVLRSDLSDLSYDLPLTLKTPAPKTWRQVRVQQGERTTQLLSWTQRTNITHSSLELIETVSILTEAKSAYQGVPNGGVVEAEVVTLSEFTEQAK